jgi:hypothetical protein
MHCPPIVAFFSDIDRRIAADNHRLELARDFSELLQKNWGGKYNTCAPRDIVRGMSLLPTNSIISASLLDD